MNLAFYGTYEDRNYLVNLKPLLGPAKTYIKEAKAATTLVEIAIYCEARGVTGIITTSTHMLKKLLKWEGRAAPALQAYQGSFFKIELIGKKKGQFIEVVIIPPLKQLVTTAYSSFITRRLVTKLTRPLKWYTPTEFKWEMLTPSNESAYFESFLQPSCFLIAVDIETIRENAQITHISYSAFFYSNKAASGIVSTTVVFKLDSDWALATMRKWCGQLSAPKVLANGKYDIAYLSRYGAPLYNYLYDVQNLFHAWYSELPKDLGYLNSFFIRESVYWKDLAKTNDSYEYCRYNGLDTWGTGNVLLAMLLEAPPYAFDNYLLEFPLVFPCHLSEMTGIKRDAARLEQARAEQDTIITTLGTSLDKILGVTNFNTNSSKQMKSVLKILGYKNPTSADEKALKKARFHHPLNARVLGMVIKVRKARKLASTYLTTGDKAKEFNGRVLYSLNPHGTDSSRLASREHHFWCGLQVQNIPRGKLVKQTLRADPGFYLAEVDLEQAESRDTAYIAGEETMIAAVEHSPDFHSANASAFFGVPFDKIFSVSLCKVLDKKLRDLAKSVNHGANYNMGWYVLIDTMGEERVLIARNLLGLPKSWLLKDVAIYLLDQFHVTYPDIKGTFYPGVVKEIKISNRLTSKAIHHTEHTPVITSKNYEYEYNKQLGTWTRYCFSDPARNKQALNSYISHPPQALNAQTLNKGVLKVFTKLAMHPEHKYNFKLLAQIHDSILFQYRIGHDYLCEEVKRYMEIPITIKGYDNKVRTFTVPAGIKKGIGGKPATYWSETE